MKKIFKIKTKDAKFRKGQKYSTISGAQGEIKDVFLYKYPDGRTEKMVYDLGGGLVVPVEEFEREVQEGYYKMSDSKIKDADTLIEKYQQKVDYALKTFGRIGGGLYDELDDNHLYVDQNNKVKYQVSRDSNVKDYIGERYRENALSLAKIMSGGMGGIGDGKESKLRDGKYVVNNMNDLKRLFSNFPKGDVDIDYGRSGFYYHIRPKADGKVSLGSAGYDGTFNTLREALEWVADNFGDLILNVKPDGSDRDSKIKDTWIHIENYRDVEIYRDDDTGDYGFSHNKGKRLYNTHKKDLKKARDIIDDQLSFLNDKNVKDSKIKDVSEPNIPAKGKWEYDKSKEDWYDTGRKMYYTEIISTHKVGDADDFISKFLHNTYPTVGAFVDAVGRRYSNYKYHNTPDGGVEVLVDGKRYKVGFKLTNSSRPSEKWEVSSITEVNRDCTYKVTHKDKTYKIKATSRKDAAIKLIKHLKDTSV